MTTMKTTLYTVLTAALLSTTVLSTAQGASSDGKNTDRDKVLELVTKSKMLTYGDLARFAATHRDAVNGHSIVNLVGPTGLPRNNVVRLGPNPLRMDAATLSRKVHEYLATAGECLAAFRIVKVLTLTGYINPSHFNVLQYMPKLTTLELSDNRIGVEGAVALADALRHVPLLIKLDLSNNTIHMK